MKLIIIVCLLAAAAAQDEKISADELKVCVKDYFNGENLSSLCESSMALVEKDHIDSITASQYFEELADGTKNCAKEKFREYKIMDFLWHVEYVEELEESSSSDQKRQVVYALLQFCISSESFKQSKFVYDVHLTEIRSAASELKSTPKGQCLYKYLVENTLIDTSDFGFDTSDFDSLDCTSFFEEFEEQFQKPIVPEEDSSSLFDKCVHRKSAEHEGHGKDRAVLVAIEMFDLSETQQQKFNALVVRYALADQRFALECARDTYRTS